MEKEIIAAFGEVMLRLAPEGKKRLAQVLPGALQATFGGGEANVCASLSMLGAKSRYLTVLPDNPIAQAFATEQRGFGTDVSKILWTKTGRMGVYYAEHGAAQRGSNVIYDRAHSAIADAKPEDYDFEGMLQGCGHLHITGITPALSENAFQATLAMAETAEKMGIKISCDLNFRKKLWKWKPDTEQKVLAGECMQQIVSHADIIIGNEEDAADVFGIQAENTSIESGKLNIAGYGEVARKLSKRFPKASYVAITLREGYSADHNNWGGMLYDCAADRTYFAPLGPAGEYAPYEIRSIVDRFGGGDSFCAGLIFALRSDEYSKPADAIAFAAAASCLKHSIPGDYNYSSKAEVVSLMKGNASGRVKR